MADNHNPLKQLQVLGQSVWLDSIRRGQILSGELQKLVDEDGLRGETANPTIFEKAIGGSTDYDGTIQELVKQGKSAQEIYETIALDDVRMACDVFRPVYDQTGGADGFVSIEVSPHLAYDTERTIEQARRFFREVNRPNVLIKIPGTPEGVPAIEQCLYEGININITLLFAVRAYEEVAWAYIHALERRLDEGLPIDRIASVASFFVSRIDTLADKLIEEKLRGSNNPEFNAKLESLGGKVAIANAKEAYQRFKIIFGDPRFIALREKAGARVQRPLWASTSTKNPHYPDTMYVEGLIGPNTVNTLPLETIEAYRDHGHPRVTIEDDLDAMRRVFQNMQDVGLSLDGITDQVLKEGVVKFADSLDKLLEVIETKREAIATGRAEHMLAALGDLQGDVDAALAAADQNHVAERIWKKDAALWKDDPVHQAIIKNALGWLTVGSQMMNQLDVLRSFAAEVGDAGFKAIVLCGMGGSSLCVEVFNRTLGAAKGHPKLYVLDTTDPATILNLEKKINVAKTLFIIASKSGGTIETLDHFEYFYDKAKIGANFVAITDANSGLAKMAREKEFRRVFLNPSDIGGRYSALSYFGLVPAAAMGVDLEKVLDKADEMAQACASSVPARDNAGVWLGVILATLARRGRDKITIITSRKLESFGMWAEQLIAESTGKEGKGLVPIAGEPVGAPPFDSAQGVYGDDRVFVYLRLGTDKTAALDKKVDALEKAGQPVVRLLMDDPIAIGAEFFRWEFAIAVAGALMGINPFDQPNVQESKDNTKRVLEQYATKKQFAIGAAAWAGDKVAVRWTGPSAGAQGLRANLAAFLQSRQPGDYLAFMAYLEQTRQNDATCAKMRVMARDALKIATTVGYGPRFLHSTGQLHKGGPDKVLAVQITAEDAKDVSIPGENYTFGVLKRAQAIGDWQALETHGRRALQIHLKRGAKLEDVVAAVQAALRPEKGAHKRAAPRPRARVAKKAKRTARAAKKRR
ncbi:MAG: bifunctional transaldolase/phosoglucose isomerase [Chloroflexi bacterium]|nr:bifunctional transaldolase/phosoglucose isomerase [Chloroflexota bacterium]